MNVAFIGGTSAGKTVVGYLLEQAATIHANAKKGVDIARDREILPSEKLEEERDFLSWFRRSGYSELEFTTRSIDAASASHFKEVASHLDAGEWPPGTSPAVFYRVAINLRIEGGFLKRPREHEIGIYEISGERIKEIYETVTAGEMRSWTSWDENLITLLQSDVFVILIPSDACRELPKGDRVKAAEIMKDRKKFDWETLMLLSAIEGFKKYQGTKIRAMAVLFTKHDTVIATLPLNTNEDYSRAFAYLDETYAQLQSIVDKHQIARSLEYFKSGIKTEEVDAGGKPQILPAIGRRGVQFYVREYLKLLYWLTQL